MPASRSSTLPTTNGCRVCKKPSAPSCSSSDRRPAKAGIAPAHGARLVSRPGSHVGGGAGGGGLWGEPRAVVERGQARGGGGGARHQTKKLAGAGDTRHDPGRQD